MSTKNVAIAAGLLFAAVLVAAGAAWRSLDVPVPVSGPLHPVEFRIEPGEGFASVAGRLEEQGLVLSAWRLRALARATGADRDVRAGTYRVLPGVRPRALLRDFVEGNVRLARFTVPEGWRLTQIAAEAERVLGVPADSLLAEAEDPERRRALGSPAANLEGYLFPETYYFPDGVSAGEVVDGMTRRFEEVWESLPPPLAGSVIADEGDPVAERHGVVTLASIVEAETALEEEKPRIAAVYLNRLAKGWKLQADPTVRYGIERFTGRLYYKHLDIDTPYNTYMHPGLPPGPIGASGEASLRAVLAPPASSDEFYFVASGDGGHVFSRTQAEHALAKLRARSGAGGSAAKPTEAGGAPAGASVAEAAPAEGEVEE